MNIVRKNVLIALAALSLGSAAYAAEGQATAPAQHGARQQMTQEQRDARRAEFQKKMAEHMAQRTQKLHDALQLSSAQEQAWTSFVASMKPAQHDRAQHQDRKAFAALPAPQRMQKMIDMSKQRTAAMESRLSALNTFYSVLNPQQKKVFDEQTADGMGMHGMHGWRGEHHGMNRG
jgi:Spy/CpxP family protein refolding chaperone